MGRGLKELERVGGGAHDQALVERIDHDEAALVGKGAGKLQRLLKVVAALYQFDALGYHGAVFLLAVAVRDDDDGFQAKQPSGHADALAMVSASRGDDAGQVGMSLLEPVAVDQSASQFECADWAMIFMLDPGFHARLLAGRETLVDQRPGVLRRGRHVAVDDGLGFLNLRERWELHDPSIRSRGLRIKVWVDLVPFYGDMLLTLPSHPLRLVLRS